MVASHGPHSSSRATFSIRWPWWPLLPLTSTILSAALTRIDVAPDSQNGLQMPSQVMVHRISSVRREKVGAVIGHLDDLTMLAVSRAVVVFLGLA